MNFLSGKGLLWSILDNFVTLVKGQYSDLIFICAYFVKFCKQCYACSQYLCKFSWSSDMCIGYKKINMCRILMFKSRICMSIEVV